MLFALCGVRCDIRILCSSGTCFGIGGCMARISLSVFSLFLLVLPSGSFAVSDLGNVRFVHPSVDPNFGGTQPSYSSLNHTASGWRFDGQGKIGWVGKPQATVTASRSLDFAKAGKFLGKKARLLGPLGWVTLAFSGIGWVWDYADNRGWLKPLSSNATLVTYDVTADSCSQNRTLKTGQTIYDSSGRACTLSDNPNGVSGWYGVNNINCGYFPNMCTPTDTSAYNGLYWKPGGYVAPSPEYAPATDSEMDTELERIARENPAATTWAWAPGDAVPSEAERPVVTGPASVVGPETITTTQSPSGTTTRRQAKTADLTYAGDVVKADIRTVTTTTNPDGSVETEEEVIGSDEEPKPAETADFCEDHPTASACLPRWCDEHPTSLECQDVTQLPTLPEVELESRSIDADIESEWTSSGTCPSPGSLLIGGRQIEWPWQPICDFASGLRPVVIAVALLSAALFVFGMVRE